MITHEVKNGFCLVDCRAEKGKKGTKVTGKQVYDYCMNMVAEDPSIAKMPNIWDFTNVQILGELDKLTDLHVEIGPLIISPVKVAFVSNLPLTRSIAKYYVEMFINHEYLSYEVFETVKEAKDWTKKR